MRWPDKNFAQVSGRRPKVLVNRQAAPMLAKLQPRTGPSG